MIYSFLYSNFINNLDYNNKIKKCMYLSLLYINNNIEKFDKKIKKRKKKKKKKKKKEKRKKREKKKKKNYNSIYIYFRIFHNNLC